MAVPGFGDRVRIVSAPETEVGGFAGRIGEVWSESEPCESGVGPVIGERGENRAFSVLFENSEDIVWFAPHLLKPATSSSRRPLFVFFAALIVAAAPALATLGTSGVHRLGLVNAATPCFPVQNYVTSGVYPNVRGDSKGAVRTNFALLRAVTTDQRRYARAARGHAADTGAGTYQTQVDQNLISASTVVVSALIPTLKLYPDGTGGQTWISATVDVHSGQAVSLRQLLANPTLALAVLARDSQALLRPAGPASHPAGDSPGNKPSLANYRYFALTPTGLALGLRPLGRRAAAIIPYRLVHPYLNQLGRHLVAGVRRPRSNHGRSPIAPTWASTQYSPLGVDSSTTACI